MSTTDAPAQNTISPDGFLDKAKKFLSVDSRGIGIEVDGISYINVPTPAWYPDSFIRSLKNSLYLKMIDNSAYRSEKDNPSKLKLEFYKEKTGGNAIVNALSSAVNSLITVGANQVASVANKAQSIVDSVKSMFSSEDKEKEPSLASTIAENQQIPFLASQPYLEIRGIHVTEGITATLDIIKDVISLASSAIGAVDKMVKGKSIDDIFNSVNEKVKNAFKQTFGVQGGDWKSIAANAIFNENYRMHSIAEQMMRQSLCGKYTMMCKVPLLNNNGILIQSCGEEGFKRGVLGYGSKGGNTNMTQMIAEEALGDVNIGFSSSIKWFFDTDNAGYKIKPINTTFTIFNDTFEHFMVNYAFIYGFMATTKAVTDGMLVRAPYVYDIVVPGGIRYQMCTCTASVKNVGRLRKLSAKSDVLATKFNESFNVPINANVLEYIPDAYEVTLSFTSLLPDLWNFIESYINMNTQSEKNVVLGDEISSTLATFLKHLTK